MKIVESNPAVDGTYSWPRTGVSGIDRELEGWVRSQASEMLRMAKDNADGRAWSSDMSYSIVRNDDAVFTVLFSHYTFTGGAHPNTARVSFNFLRPDGFQADIAELFTPRGIRLISALSITQLKRRIVAQGGVADSEWVQRGAGPLARNFRTFALLPDALVVYFDAYQVGPYAAGPQEVRLPMSRLKDMLRPNPRAPAASFDCAGARGDIETAICGSVALARLDRRLADLHVQRIELADNVTVRLRIRQEQRDWLKARDSRCRVAGFPIMACLTQAYQARLRELEP